MTDQVVTIASTVQAYATTWMIDSRHPTPSRFYSLFVLFCTTHDTVNIVHFTSHLNDEESWIVVLRVHTNNNSPRKATTLAPRPSDSPPILAVCLTLSSL